MASIVFEIGYFELPGSENLRETFKLSNERAEKLGMKNLEASTIDEAETL